MVGQQIVGREPGLDPCKSEFGWGALQYLRPFIYIGTTAATIFYLAGSGIAGICFMTMVLGVLLPATALLSRLPVMSGLAAGERLIAAAALALAGATPWFYIRRLFPNATVVDVLTIAVLVGAAWRTGAFRSYLSDLKGSMLGLSPALLLFWLPLIFACNWAGYAVPRATSVAFYGLAPVDFCNLSSIVSLVKASDGLPLTGVVGGGPLHYHWLYFTLPAWLSDFCGSHMPAANCLVLCNGLVACLFLLALAQVARKFAGNAHPHAITLCVAIVAFAPLVTYAYQFLAAALHAPWFQPGDRNQLLLSVVNSMLVFGNNTLAILFILVIALLLERWNGAGRFGHGFLICLFLCLIPGYSATLTATVAIALAVWLLIGRVRYPLRAMMIALPMACLAWLVLHRLNILGGPRQVAMSWDRGAFVLTFVLSTLPLWLLAALAGNDARRAGFWWVLIAAGLVVPSVFRTIGQGSMSSDLSMKTATLIIVAMCPLVAVGLNRCLVGKVSTRWLFVPAAGVLLLGFLNTAAYTGQFVLYRAIGSTTRSQTLPVGYYRSLENVRDTTSVNAIVLDPTSLRYDSTLWTVDLAERRAFLPNDCGLLGAKPDGSRLLSYRRWENSRFGDRELSRYFSRQADYLVLPGRPSLEPIWTFVRSFDGYAIFESQLARK